MGTKTILVLGASGYIGSRLVPLLTGQGYRVRVAARSAGALRQRPWAEDPNIEIFTVDLLDLPRLREACAGCEAAYYLVHSMNPGQKDFAEADRRAANNMVSAADGSGLERVIYLGGLGDENTKLSKHLRSRAEVGHILHSGKVAATTLRAAMVIGAGSASFEILRYLVERLPVMLTPRWVMTLSQPIAVRNILQYLAGCLARPETSGRIFDVGGPDILSYRSLMDIYAEEAGIRKPFVIPVPLLSPHLSSYWIGLVTPVSSALGRPLAEGLCNEVVCLDNAIRQIIPQPLLTCREAIRSALDPRQYAVRPQSEGQRSVPPVEWWYPGDPPWVRRTAAKARAA